MRAAGEKWSAFAILLTSQMGKKYAYLWPIGGKENMRFFPNMLFCHIFFFFFFFGGGGQTEKYTPLWVWRVYHSNKNGLKLMIS